MNSHANLAKTQNDYSHIKVTPLAGALGGDGGGEGEGGGGEGEGGSGNGIMGGGLSHGVRGDVAPAKRKLRPVPMQHRTEYFTFITLALRTSNMRA